MVTIEAPIYYDYATQYNNAIQPSSVRKYDNEAYRFYMDYLLKRCMSVFDFGGIPDNWDKDFLLYQLFCSGRAVVFRSPTFGTIVQGGMLSGYNLYYRPILAFVANPSLPVSECGAYWLAESYNPRRFSYVRGTAQIIKLQRNYKGVLDICSITAARLAYIHEAISMNLANSKLAYIFAAKDKNAAELFKAALDAIQRGELAVVTGRGLWDAQGRPLWSAFSTDLKQNYIVHELLEDLRGELNDFNNFVGIPSTNYNKKAHMTVAEVDANDVETESLADEMLDCLQESITRVNAQYGLALTVKKRYAEKDVEEAGKDGAD